MKVIREEESFKPVTIVLESQDELDWLFCCLAGSCINVANKVYANELGRTTQRFSFGEDNDIGVGMYEAVRKLMEGEYK